MMKVLLVKPYNLSDHIQPSLGLGYLATAIRDKHEVKILDCIKEDIRIDKFASYIKEYNPDVVGFQCYAFDLKFIKAALKLCKQVSPSLITLVGGPHPSAVRENVLACFGEDLDFAFVGEAETGLPVLLEFLSTGLGQVTQPTQLNKEDGQETQPTQLNKGAGQETQPTQLNKGAGQEAQPPQLSKGAGQGTQPPPLSKGAGQGTQPPLLSKIPGLIWRNAGRTIVNPPVFVENLDSLGMPAWDLINPQDYPPAQHGAFFKNFPIAPIIATRGCPFPCTFCAGSLVSGRKIRRRSVKHILDEIELLYKKYGIREIHIVDDNFTMSKDFTIDFLKGLIARKLDLSWTLPNGIRLDTVDEEMLELMKKSGLYLLTLGIESGSDRVLKLMKKGTTTEKIRRYVKMITDSGLNIAGFFMLGFPGETIKEMNRTIQFSLELKIVRANYFTYLPFPGTESYNQLIARNELNAIDWERCYFMNATYAPRGISRKELRNLQRKGFIMFFSRPVILYKNLMCIKSVVQFGFLLKRFYHWLIMK